MIKSFAGLDTDLTSLRRAMLRQLRAVPVDHPVREKAETLMVNAEVLAFSLSSGDRDVAGVRIVLQAEWEALEPAVNAAVRASLN